jgi:hypothetical protein
MCLSPLRERAQWLSEDEDRRSICFAILQKESRNSGKPESRAAPYLLFGERTPRRTPRSRRPRHHRGAELGVVMVGERMQRARAVAVI